MELDYQFKFNLNYLKIIVDFFKTYPNFRDKINIYIYMY